MSKAQQEKKLAANGPRTHRLTVGTRPDRPDGVDKVTGRARFGADFSLPGMLHGLILRSPHAHARIASIDTSAAMALSGVKACVTGADFPDLDCKESVEGRGAREPSLPCAQYDGAH